MVISVLVYYFLDTYGGEEPSRGLCNIVNNYVVVVVVFKCEIQICEAERTGLDIHGIGAHGLKLIIILKS
jgi:hypothetical protein